MQIDKTIESQNLFIPVGAFQLHCLKIGNGPNVVLAFNGYAKEASTFAFLKNPDYTVLSFDLPFQGGTAGVANAVLSKQELKALAEEIIAFYQVSKIGLVGFSLGCRACMCIAELLPNHIRKIVLVAPDGTKHNYFYQFLTATAIGRFSFRGFVRFGGIYLYLFALLHKVGLLNTHMYKFAMQYIRTPESRLRLYNIWNTTRKLIPHLHKLRQRIAHKHIPTHLIMGQQDRVISLQHGLRFKGNNPSIFVHVFERGHNMLDFEEIRGTVAAWLFRVTHLSSAKG
ncbi:MAG: alpha/beta hydrolase [Chitinophagaceae bacterium]|nr:alpha/beta hydrolase [Chitinophagaceae bacterium]